MTPLTPADIRSRRLTLGLNQTDFAAEVAATYRAHGVEPARWNAVRVSKAESGNPDPGSLLAFSLTLQRLEAPWSLR